MKTWALTDDGEPVYMVNIFHGNSKAEMGCARLEGLDFQVKEDGMKIHDVFLEAAKKLILLKSLWPAIGTKAQGVGSDKTNIAGFYTCYDVLTKININKYPSSRTVMELFSNPFYLKVMTYKLVGLRLISLPTTLRFKFPDLRLAMGTIFLVVLLVVGWVSEILRNRKLSKV